MDVKVCSFSGHRQIYKVHTESLPLLLSETVDSLIESGVSTFQSGGALGFDLLAAGMILTKRAKNPELRLRMVLPCRNQDARWPEKFRRAYRNILSSADEVIYLAEEYSPMCMQRRNRELVDRADVLLCYLMRSFGGTMNTVNYAYDKGIKIINLATLL
ncbi:MAG: DUF1273 family protein [Oscillospiraceae bacterium]|nr:DUF1273 family protein [Oscillospiraceae bacterium]